MSHGGIGEPEIGGPIAEAATRCYEAGLCVLPALADLKRPAVKQWKPYQSRLPTAAEMRAWFSNGHGAMCIVAGAVSGNLEMLDFDLGGELFHAWCERVDPALLERLVVETSPSGGRHVVYRCEEAVSGNLKLAQRRHLTTGSKPVVIGGKEHRPRKAGKEAPGAIDQPCLVLFGTAIPNNYYEALSNRMLTNGFFARMLILESERRASGQEPRIRELPERIRETARWWADYRAGTGDLESWHPIPTIVEHSEEARAFLVNAREEADAEYAKAEVESNSVGTTVWGRVSEQIRKLALLYAVSESHETPQIGLQAVRWASRLVMHQTRRMLFMAQSHVAENPFHAECLKLMKKLRSAPKMTLPHSVLLKRMKVDAQTFMKIVQTLVLQGDIDEITEPRAGKAKRSYRLKR